MQKPKYALLLLAAAATLLSAKDRTMIILGDDIVIEAGETVDAAIALGGNIDVYGTVEEAAVAIGGDVTIHSQGQGAGDAVSVGGQVFLSSGGTLKGDRVEVQSGPIGRTLNPAHFFYPVLCSMGSTLYFAAGSVIYCVDYCSPVSQLDYATGGPL